MAEKGRSRKWLWGCGIGCAALTLVLVALLVAGAYWVGSFVEGVAEAEASYRELVSAHGEVEEYAPPSDGAVPAERLARFLEVRESLRESQAGLDSLFADFPPDELLEEKRVVPMIFKAVGSIGKLIPPIAGYIDERHRLLIDADMGPGEYVYIYSIAYYSWLDHSPEDGPKITKTGAEHRGGAAGSPIFDDDDATFNARKIRRRYRRYMLALLRNQFDSLPDAGTSPESDAWRERLSAEIDRFEGWPGRVVWQDGLPPAVENSLAPYRDRLEATYHEGSNCFEMPVHDSEDWGRGWSD